MKFEEALKKAKEVMLVHDYILCGSLALMWRGSLPHRDVGDLDFISLVPVNSKDFQPISKDDWVYVRVNDGYLCYAHSLDVEHTYNIFVFDQTRNIEYDVFDGFKVQREDQILHYKKLYNRSKDVIDLNAMGSIF